MNRLVIDILNSNWLIDARKMPHYANFLLSLVKGERSEVDFSEQRKLNQSYVLAGSSNIVRYDFNDQDIPQNSIAVIPIKGEIMKYSQMCGPKGTMHIENDIKRAANNPKINSIILDIDSPGGQVDYTDILSDTIAGLEKPVIAYVNGLCASAAYWIASGVKKIIAASDLTEVGSIGTMTYFADLQPYYEAMGVKFHEFYATLSTDKNKDFKDIREGKYEKYTKEVLDVINNKFHQSVTTNRSGLDKSVLTGKVYFAPEAIKNGLIDQIGSFEDALKEAELMGNNYKSINNSNNMNVKSGWKAIISFLGFDAAKENVLTEDSIEKLNNELQSKTDALNTETTAKEKAVSDLNSVIAVLDGITDSAKEAKTVVEKASAVQAYVEELENEDASEETRAQKEKDKIDGKPDDFAAFEHNKQADQFLGK